MFWGPVAGEGGKTGQGQACSRRLLCRTGKLHMSGVVVARSGWGALCGGRDAWCSFCVSVKGPRALHRA